MKSTTLLFWGMIVATLLAACLFPTLTLAQIDVWLGGKDDWGNSSMWSAGVPNSGSDVFIDNGNGVASTVTVDLSAACQNLTVDADDGISIIHNTITHQVGHLVINGTFTNFSGGTLTGGTYHLTGGGTLQFNDAKIVTNAAKLHLGNSWAIFDQHSNDALLSLSSTTSKGAVILDHLGILSIFGPYSNAGKLFLGHFAIFSIIAIYTQTAGITWVSNNATLDAPSGVNINGGKVFGTGLIVGNLVSSGTIIPGGTPTRPGGGTLSVQGTYTQTPTGSLNTAVFSDFNSHLAASGGVLLNGTLNINQFGVPQIGTVFTILTGSFISQQFATVNGLSINNSEHFVISYNPSSVTLTVVAGPL